MPIRPGIKALFFDVFGTCVQQRTPVADQLFNAAKEALKGGGIDSEVRRKAEEMTYDDWFEFGGQWNAENDKFVKHSIAATNSVDWKAVDDQRISLLTTMLADIGLIILENNIVQKGSLFNHPQLTHLAKIWHRLPPWPDTIPGLALLNKQYTTCTLSNTYASLMRGLVDHSNIPFQHVFTSDMFNSFKPNPKVYLGAAERLGVGVEECALVAAHLGDLKGAKSCGFFAISVERALEEKAPELRKENIPDLAVEEGQGGFVRLAEMLEIGDE